MFLEKITDGTDICLDYWKANSVVYQRASLVSNPITAMAVSFELEKPGILGQSTAHNAGLFAARGAYRFRINSNTANSSSKCFTHNRFR